MTWLKHSLLTPFRQPALWLILGGVAARFMPHPPNFAPLGALALFSGATLWNRDRRLALLIPLATLFLSDLLLGFYAAMPFVYGAFIFILWCFGARGLGRLLRGASSSLVKAGGIVSASVAASLVFFFVTNAGVWLTSDLYPRTLDGLVLCFVAALPFFWHSLAGDLFFSSAIFGVYFIVTIPRRVLISNTET